MYLPDMFKVPTGEGGGLDVEMRPRGKARSTTVESLLGMLSLRPMSGYELQISICRTIGNFWQESFGQIYPALRRMAEDGLVEIVPPQGDGTRAEASRRGLPGNGGSRKSIVYRLTQKGWDQLQTWLGLRCERQVMRNELLLKLFFAIEAPDGATIAHVREEQTLLRVDLERYRALEARLPVAQRDNPSLPYFLLTLRHGILYAEAMLRWCEEAIGALEALTEKPTSAVEDGPAGTMIGRNSASGAAQQMAEGTGQ